ncbi:LAFA_0E03950g1_1 [Lachancea sp. 'fantastica']|nr:LAFA_0E03950g1_1 [Lachancea sp. 'fantastica']
MSGYQVKSGHDEESYFNDSFYSSNSIDNSDHARNFRNSVVLPDMSRDTSYDSGLRLPKAENVHEFEDPQDSNGYTDDFADVEETETETKTLKVTASPSLSALSGILSDKTRRVENRMRKSMLLEQSIQEETPSLNNESVALVKESPNLIDIGGSNGGNFMSFKQEHGHNAVQEQPDFLMTPKMDPPTPRVEPAASDFPTTIESKQDPLQETEKNSTKANVKTPGTGSAPTESAESVNASRPIAKKQASSIRSFSGMSSSSRGSVEQSGKESSDARKRKNIFSFLRRKPQKSASFIVTSPHPESSLPTSSTFSIPKTGEDDGLPASTRLTKKSHSNGSIFSAFRKNKSGNKEGSGGNSPLPKQRQKQNYSTSIHDDVPIKRDVRARKPTPLNFEHRTQSTQFSGNDSRNFQAPAEKEVKESVHEAEALQRNSPDISTQEAPILLANNISLIPAPEVPETSGSDFGKVDSGEVLFPKSLSAQEVESIVSLERSRSVKSNKRNSINSHRRSFTDHISAKVQNGGMYITEPAGVKLSTPDLTKSPTNSILRNGTFDSLEFSPQKSISRSQKDSAPQSSSFNPGDRDFSFTSIEQKLNDLTVDSDSEDNYTSPKKKTNAPAADNYEREFMSDIMEFANIIDFGKDLNLDLEFNSAENGYRSLNPTENSRHSLKESDIPQSDSLDLGLPSRERNQNDSNVLLGPPLATMSQRSNDSDRSVSEYLASGIEITDNDEDFEDENFNQLDESIADEDEIASPWQSPITQGSRPLSLSFKGLRANQLNNPPAKTLMQPSSSAYTMTDSFAGSTSAKTVAFSSHIILYATYTENEYDRHPDIATCNQLTPQLAQMIKDELNTLKSEMEVHEESKCYTHFY